MVPVQSLASGPLPEHYGQQFLNTTVADVMAAQRAGHSVVFDARGVVARAVMRPGVALTIHPKIYGSDNSFLSYCESWCAMRQREQ